MFVESLAAGTPVIASRLGGLAELVREGEDGLLFEAGNDTAACAAQSHGSRPMADCVSACARRRAAASSRNFLRSLRSTRCCANTQRHRDRTEPEARDVALDMLAMLTSALAAAPALLDHELRRRNNARLARRRPRDDTRRARIPAAACTACRRRPVPSRSGYARTPRPRQQTLLIRC